MDRNKEVRRENYASILDYTQSSGSIRCFGTQCLKRFSSFSSIYTRQGSALISLVPDSGRRRLVRLGPTLQGLREALLARPWMGCWTSQTYDLILQQMRDRVSEAGWCFGLSVSASFVSRYLLRRDLAELRRPDHVPEQPAVGVVGGGEVARGRVDLVERCL